MSAAKYGIPSINGPRDSAATLNSIYVNELPFWPLAPMSAAAILELLQAGQSVSLFFGS